MASQKSSFLNFSSTERVKQRGGEVLNKKGGPTDNLNVNKRGWQSVVTNYGCSKQNFITPYLDINDTGATLTLNKIRKAVKEYSNICI